MRAVSLTVALLLVLLATLRAADNANKVAADKVAADKVRLAPLQDYVGEWRGVGQPRRGITRGSWAEDAAWQWQFKEGQAALVVDIDDGKYFSSARLVAGRDKGMFELIALLPDGKTEERYLGKLNDDEQLVLEAQQPSEDRPARITIRMVAAGKRLLILLERQVGDADRYLRIAEVGYTRKGSGFGTGPSFPECVVTGGYATIEVKHDGKTYKVCCQGCKDLFEMDPVGVLAEYQERKEEERNAPKK